MDTTTYETTIRTEPAVRVAALRHDGDYQAIGSTFERLMALAVGQGLLGAAPRSFGIYYDDPSATPVNALRADACVAVPPGATPGGDLRLTEIRGGRYATVLHVGPYAELERVYRWLYGTWLAQSGEEPADAPTIEAYLNDARVVRRPGSGPRFGCRSAEAVGPRADPRGFRGHHGSGGGADGEGRSPLRHRAGGT